jgi:ADP-ribose pyrophosphatase YjhB (NUDIX family)
MKTVLMAVAIIKKGDSVLIRKFDPTRNPYPEAWGLFGGRLEGDGEIIDSLNRELQERWNMTVAIAERIGWDEEKKVDHDGEEKRFIYLDVLCDLADGEPEAKNPQEELRWVEKSELRNYDLNPPSAKVLGVAGYLS